MASAIVELRTSLGESQQKFSERLVVALATVARWEIGDRHPALRSIKEMWYLAAEQDLPHLGKIFADAFAQGAGYQLSGGEVGFRLRNLLSDVQAEVGQLLHDKSLTPEARDRAGRAMGILHEVRTLLREVDLEPPFRSAILIKGKNKK
jgi:transcriptional regulator with XRE-family HTH domain